MAHKYDLNMHSKEITHYTHSMVLVGNNHGDLSLELPVFAD